MSVWALLRHRLRAYGRAPFRGRRLVSLLLGTAVALYFGAGLALAGVFFDDLVREVAPGADPLLVAAKGLLPFGLGYAALRVVMGAGLGVDPRPYRSLPVRRSALVGLLAAFALLSLWNAVPLALPTLVTNDPVLQLSMIAGTGLLSALAYPLWLRGLTSLHEWNHYAMLRGFRASGE